MSGIEVRDSGDLRKYRTEVPNLVFEMGLSPYALALYMHFRRTAGDDGKCWKSTRTLASGTGISAGTISKARKELEERDLIGVQYPENNNKSIVVTITDIWPENFQHFAGQTPKPKTPAKTRSRRDTPVQETNAPVQETNATCSPGERRKEPTEEGTIKEESTDSSEDAKTESLSNYHMKRIYDAMKKANYTITGKSKKENEYGRLVGRVQWMLDNMSPTDEELEGLPEAYVQAYTIRGAATDAVYALNELRRQKARGELLSETRPATWEPVNPHGEAGTQARSKARSPIWYASCYPVSHETAQGWIDEGLGHDEILVRLEGERHAV